MLIVHLSYIEDGFAFWGERSVDTRAPKLRGRPRKQEIHRASPYDAGDAIRIAAGDPSLLGPWALKKKTSQAFAWLPGTSDAPIPSSPLIADSTSESKETALTPWRVTILKLSLQETIHFLAAAADRHMLMPGTASGREIPFAWDLLRHAGSLVARQQFIPSVHFDENTCSALWKPVVSGADLVVSEQFATNFPYVMIALTSAADAPAPVCSRKACIDRMLEKFVDHLVRSAARRVRTHNGAADKRRSQFPSLHDQWLHALAAADGILSGTPKELVDFASSVAAWHRPLDVTVSSHYRLCFRLSEPPPEIENPDKGNSEAQPWTVEYLLQPLADKSLLLPLGDIWNAAHTRSSIIKEASRDARQYILASLGQASGISPDIHASMLANAPAGFVCNTESAYRFLSETSLALEQAGFGVMLPAWWTRKGTKPRLSAQAHVKSPVMQTAGSLSMDTIMKFNWELALGDQKLTLKELESLAKLKSPLVQWRGQWVELNGEELRTAISYWKTRTQSSATLAQIVRMKLGAVEKLNDVDFTGVTATGWVGTLLDQLDGQTSFRELPAPANFSGTLRPYQIRGYSWMTYLKQWNLGACLADDMGLGKTIQVLAMIEQERINGESRPVLIVCPTSVVNNWQMEARRFTPDVSVMVHHGMDRKKGASFEREARKHSVVVSTYALLQRDLIHLMNVPWAGVILDEAQNIKNAQTKQSHAARTLKAGYRIALSGTPVENNVGDLWSIMEFLNPGFLGTQSEFRNKFFIPIQTGQDPSATDRLKKLTAPFILRRLKSDRSVINDLPDKMEMKVYCPLTKEQASLYAAVVKEMENGLPASSDIGRKGLILATLSKLKQICNHPAHFLGDNSSIPERSGKLARLTEMLEEIISNDEKTLVFTQFAEMGMILRKHLQETFGREVFFLYGGTQKKERDRMVDTFQNDRGASPIFLLSLKAGGTGLNLTQASHVFHYDRWWNPAVENQATDRAYRIGQKKNVQVHKFICAGTLEETIDEMIERKKTIAEMTVGTGEGWLTEFSNAELKEIFTLRNEAIETI